MKPRSHTDHRQRDLFQPSFSQILNPDHPLLILAEKIDWKRFDVAVVDCFCPDFGAPALSTRLMVGLLYLKHAFNESDESLLERWVENPYWQAFCGFTTMQHEAPIHPTSLVKWRQRVGAEKLAELLKETLSLAVREKQVAVVELQQVNVDTTVQEKNITPPTDSKLLHRALEKLVSAAKKRGIRLRQSYQRKAKTAAMMAGRYAHARQFKRMRRELRKINTWLGRVLRDVERKVSDPDESPRKLTKTIRKRRKRRCAIEPKIGHLKQDHRMGRCFLKGLAGDAINAVLSAAGSNLRKLLRLFFALFLSLWSQLTGCLAHPHLQETNIQPA